MTTTLTTTTEAAAHLGITPRHVRHLITTGQLPAIKQGRDWLIKETDLQPAEARKRRGRPRKETEMKISAQEIHRHGNHIRLGDGWTAIEEKDGNLPALRIRKDGKDVKFYRGSSLGFSDPLTTADKEYLATLAGGSVSEGA